MTEPENAPQTTAETTEVSVELPAKVVETTEVVTTSENARSDGTPDAATQAMEAEPKE